MSDWREIAVDDIINEVEETSLEGKKQLEEKKVKIKPRTGLVPPPRPVPDPVTVSFCCAVSVPADFNVLSGDADIAWVNCLQCIETIEPQEVFCSGGNVSCGYVDACVQKIVGCIEFIVSAPVTGYDPCTSSGGTSNICCSGSVCVNECFSCEIIEEDYCGRFCNGRDNECDGDIEGVTITPRNVVVNTTACTPHSTTVTFTGFFDLTCGCVGNSR